MPKQPIAKPVLTKSQGVAVQRKCSCGGPAAASGECEECKKKKLQRKASNSTVRATAPPSVDRVLKSPGQAMDPATRGFMEPRFEHDFGKVRIHADEQASRSARDVNALAYTVGPHVVLDRDRYEPNTPAGLRLMAHELAHVVQQQDSVAMPGAIDIGAAGDPSEIEADRAAESVVRSAPEHGAGVSRASQSVLRRQPAASADKPADAAGVPGESRVIGSFDVTPGNKRPWNLNQLTKDIVTALSASDLAYVTVLGAYPTKENEDDPQGQAYVRADTVRRALIQWIGPNKFDEKRYEVAFSTASIGDPEVQVMISYKGKVVSERKGASPEIGPPRPPKADAAASTAPPVPSLVPNPPRAGSAGDALSAFLATPPGQQLKANALKELKKVWTKTTLAEKIGIIANLLAIAGISSYGLAKMSPNQQKGVLDLIVGDDDKTLQQPLPSKTLLDFDFDF